MQRGVSHRQSMGSVRAQKEPETAALHQQLPAAPQEGPATPDGSRLQPPQPAHSLPLRGARQLLRQRGGCRLLLAAAASCHRRHGLRHHLAGTHGKVGT